jgi:hypothetical protein
MGLHRLVEKVLTGVQFGTAYADAQRSIPFARAGPFVALIDAQPTLTARTSGTVFVNRSTTDLTIAMPLIATVPSGVYWDFFNVAAFDLIFDGAVDEMLGYGADELVQILRGVTDNEMIGWGVRFISDGTLYLPMISLGDATQTIAHAS